MHRRLLSKAFEVLMVYEDGAWVVPWDRWHQLVHTIFPEMGQTKIDLMLYVLDDNHNDMIGTTRCNACLVLDHGGITIL